jgi:hypothetical protein
MPFLHVIQPFQVQQLASPVPAGHGRVRASMRGEQLLEHGRGEEGRVTGQHEDVPVDYVAQVFDDPQVIHRRMRLDLPDAVAKGGSIPGVRNPIVFSDSTFVYDRPSPQLGADTEDIIAAVKAGRTAFRTKS